MKDILVGVDGSPGSRHALDRALRLGQATGRTVRALHVWAPPAPRSAALGVGYLYDPFQEREDAREAALQLVDDEVTQALGRLESDAPVTVRADQCEGSVGHELVRHADTSAIALIGTRGRSRIGNLLGSSILHVLHHAPCPVMVVPAAGPTRASYGRVVVGVDGSDWSRSAILWAHELARVEHAALHVVHAVARGDAPVHVEERALWRKEVMAALPSDSSVEVDVDVVAGPPDEVLTHGLGPDDLLVVGSRGAGGFTGVVLGSVSAACIAHPTVPVLVVKAHEEGLAHLFGPASEPVAEVG